MPIVLNIHGLTPTLTIMMYASSDPSVRFVRYEDLYEWLVEKMGLYGRPHSLTIQWEDEECGPTDEFSLKGCSLDVFVREDYYLAQILTHHDNGLVAWTRHFASVKEAVRHMFVWLVKNDWLDVQGFLDDPTAVNAEDHDPEEAGMRRHLQAVLDGEEDELELSTVEELWEWCDKLSTSFPRAWSFEVKKMSKNFQA